MFLRENAPYWHFVWIITKQASHISSIARIININKSKLNNLFLFDAHIHMCLEPYLDVSYLIRLYLSNSGLCRICGDLTAITFIICMTELYWTAPCMLMYAPIFTFPRMNRQILVSNDVETIHHSRPYTPIVDLWWHDALIKNLLGICGYILFCVIRLNQLCWTPGRHSLKWVHSILNGGSNIKFTHTI